MVSNGLDFLKDVIFIFVEILAWLLAIVLNYIN